MLRWVENEKNVSSRPGFWSKAVRCVFKWRCSHYYRMDWLISAGKYTLKYAPELLGIVRGTTAVWNGNGDADSATHLVKSVVMLGVKEVAGNCCESAVQSGAAVAVSSLTVDVAASTATGRDYGMVKDLRNGDYLAVGATGASDFMTGYSLYEGDDKNPKTEAGKKNELPPGQPDPKDDGNQMFESIPHTELDIAIDQQQPAIYQQQM